MFKPVSHPILESSIQMMMSMSSDQKASMVLGALLDGKECFCTEGVICKVAADQGLVKLSWVPLAEAVTQKTIWGIEGKRLAEIGVTHVASFDGRVFSIPPAVRAELEMGESLHIGPDADTKLSRVNDQSRYSLADIATRMCNEGVYTVR